MIDSFTDMQRSSMAKLNEYERLSNPEEFKTGVVAINKTVEERLNLALESWWIDRSMVRVLAR